MRKNIEEKTHYLDSGEKSLTQNDPETFQNLPTSVSLQLLRLMKEVTKEVTPQTVNAACNCASQIHKILKLSEKL